MPDDACDYIEFLLYGSVGTGRSWGYPITYGAFLDAWIMQVWWPDYPFGAEPPYTIVDLEGAVL